MKRSRTQIHRFLAAFETLEPRRLLAVTALPNVQVTSNADVQQQPSIVVDPKNPKHLVIAYMDRSLVSSGRRRLGLPSPTRTMPGGPTTRLCRPHCRRRAARWPDASQSRWPTSSL